MGITVAVIAQGMMGAGVGRRLHESGAEVRTLLSGRSAASAERAQAAGMIAGGRRARVARRAPISSCRSCRRARPSRWRAAWRRRSQRWPRSRSMSIATRSARRPPSRVAAIVAPTGAALCRWRDHRRAAARAGYSGRRSMPRAPAVARDRRRCAIGGSTGGRSTGRSAPPRGSRCPMPGSPRARPRSPRRCCWARRALAAPRR